MTARRTCEQCGSLMPLLLDLPGVVGAQVALAPTGSTLSIVARRLKVGVDRRVWMSLRAVRLVDLVMRSVNEPVSHVFKMCAVDKVAQKIVVTDAIQVANLQTWRRRTDEGLHDKPVDICCSFSASMMKGDLHVAPGIWVDLFDTALGISHTAGVRDLVQTFPARDGQPAFMGHETSKRTA